MSYDNSGKLGFSVIFWFYCTGVGGQVLSFEWEAVCCVYASMELSDFIIYLCFKWTYMLECLSWNPSCLQCVLPFFPLFFFFVWIIWILHYLNICLCWLKSSYWLHRHLNNICVLLCFGLNILMYYIFFENAWPDFGSVILKLEHCRLSVCVLCRVDVTAGFVFLSF